MYQNKIRRFIVHLNTVYQYLLQLQLKVKVQNKLEILMQKKMQLYSCIMEISDKEAFFFFFNDIAKGE